MPLFRVQDLWTFNLSQLHPSSESAQKLEDQANEHTCNANFVMCIGNFQPIGPHDVFVCASLDGLLCIVQVPDIEQNRFHYQSDRNTSTNECDMINERQLLAVKRVGYPVVDVKCGYFLSSIKQSIAVLSFDQLVFFQVKRENQSDTSTRSKREGHSTKDLSVLEDVESGDQLLFDEKLFSLKLEERHRVDLLKIELASSIVVVEDHHYPSSEETAQSSSLSPANNSAHMARNKMLSPTFGDRSHSLRNRLSQRNSMIVQYTNQFLFTMIDNKKVVGHFKLCRSDTKQSCGDQGGNVTTGNSEDTLQNMAENLGRLPLAVVRELRQPSVIVSLTDNMMYSIPWSGLIAAAKMDTVRKVALNLFNESKTHNLLQIDTSSETDSNNALSEVISVDLDVVSSWSKELAQLPLDIIAVSRSRPSSATEANKSSSRHSQSMGKIYGELIILSRSSLDLLSSSGVHIWSHKFESPLICLSSFILDPPKNSTTPDESMLTLVCTDCLSENRCNLLIFNENRIVWSAMMDLKPAQISRANLSIIQGCIVLLDAKECQLSAMFLGTSTDSKSIPPEAIDEDYSMPQLESLDSEVISCKQASGVASRSGESRDRFLNVSIALEAINRWPNVEVDCKIKVRLEGTKVLHKLIAVMEFDNLIHFEPTGDSKGIRRWSSSPSSVIEIELGSYWPDRPEPMTIEGKFALASSCNETVFMDEDDRNWNPSSSVIDRSKLVPKSLEVNVYFRFNEICSGSLVQEEFFLLPLSLIATIDHLDYSSGEGQNLEDFQANLIRYQRRPASSRSDQMDLEVDASKEDVPPFYLLDLILDCQIDLISVIDFFIESDLICRNLEASTRHQTIATEVLEKMNLLAQSLDCRLKFKGSAHQRGYSSNDDAPRIVIATIALKVPKGSYGLTDISLGTDKLDSTNVKKNESLSFVWLHFVDLSVRDTSIPEEILKQHMKEWKLHRETYNKRPGRKLNSGQHLAIFIESDSPITALFVQSHMEARLGIILGLERDFELDELSETKYDDIEINFENVFQLRNTRALSINLHDALNKMASQHREEIVLEYHRLKGQLKQSYDKFKISSSVLLSIAKRLSNLPPNMRRQFAVLSDLTKQYQLQLLKISSDLESLKVRDYACSKIPNIRGLCIEADQNNSHEWPKFHQIMN